MIRALFILIILTTTTLSCFSQTEDKRDKNQKYLDANTTGIKIFNNRELLTKKMVEILEAKEHTYRTVFDEPLVQLMKVLLKYPNYLHIKIK